MATCASALSLVTTHVPSEVPAPYAVSFSSAAQHAAPLSDAALARPGAPEVAGQAVSAANEPSAIVGPFGGQSSVPETNHALDLALGLLSIGAVLSWRGLSAG